MARILKGAPVAAALTERMAARATALSERGVTPCLAIVRVGERPDDLSYERGACNRARKVGIAVRKFELPADCTQGQLEDAIRQVNADDTIHGCLMFRPLPRTLDERAACELLDPAKDVDGICRASLAGVFAGDDTGFSPCTAAAVVELLDHYGVVLEGARVAVVGRSLVIGRPVAQLLMARNATVTTCHTRTRDLAAELSRADIVVAAAGHAGTVTAGCVRSGQVVVDVGINWDEASQRLVGDVAFDEVEPIVDAITPVPAGVGSVTTAVLAKHVVEACERMSE